MNYLPQFNFYGVDVKQIPCITGEGAPTTATEGAVGCLYMDTLTGDIYKCTAVEDGVYTWEAFESGGNTEVVQEAGDSETAVMSQKAVTTELDSRIKGEFVPTDNLIDKSAMITGSWWQGSVGAKISLQTNQYTSAYRALKAVIPANVEQVTLCGYNLAAATGGVVKFYDYRAVDENGVVIDSKVVNEEFIRLYSVITNSFTIELPEGTAELYINVSISVPDGSNVDSSWTVAVFEGNTPKDYVPYGAELVCPHRRELLEKLQQVKLVNTPRIIVPNKWIAVVGDTLQLFYRGIVEHPNPYIFNIEVICDIGKNTSRYFEVTPTSEQLGEHAVTINVRDCRGNILATATTSIEVIAVATSPAVLKNVICIGDSLTSNGIWVKEFLRRLTATDGTPVGAGLSNINFIGTCQSGNAKFEGYGGWTWAKYLSAPSENTSDVWVYCTHDKTESDQHSIWQDVNGSLWVLETIEENRLKFTRYNDHTNLMPDSGSLTAYQNATNQNAISYDSIQIADGNPFWDASTDTVDFASYCERNGFNGIDVVYCLLSWNGGVTTASLEAHINNAKTFLRTLHTQYPNANVKLMGLQIPSLNGGTGANYGANNAYSNAYLACRYVMEMNIAYQELANDAEFSSYVEFVNISAQFDSENNMPQEEKSVNIRNSAQKEKVGTNGVHPAVEGYYQIADVAYRSVMNSI